MTFKSPKIQIILSTRPTPAKKFHITVNIYVAAFVFGGFVYVLISLMSGF